LRENVTAVCVSGKAEHWKVSEIPFYCHTEGFNDFPHYPRLKTRERVEYLSERRNAANERLLELYPETKHFLSIDSYYLNQVNEIRHLVAEYTRFSGDCILGATNWFLDYSRFPARRTYWDTWATPEMRQRSYNYYPKHEGLPEGWERVGGCGGFALYPRWLWEKRRYGIPEPFPEAGNEVNYLCQHPGIASFVTFNVKAHRETPQEILNKPLVGRIRTTIGLRSRLGIRTLRAIGDCG
jgi:hypothetical protein